LVPSFPSADPLIEKGGGWGTASLFNIELVDEPSVIHQFFLPQKQRRYLVLPRASHGRDQDLSYLSDLQDERIKNRRTANQPAGWSERARCKAPEVKRSEAYLVRTSSDEGRGQRSRWCFLISHYSRPSALSLSKAAFTCGIASNAAFSPSRTASWRLEKSVDPMWLTRGRITMSARLS